MPRSAAVAVALLVLIVAPFAAALDTTPSEILAHPDRFDRQPVTLSGKVTNLSERVSRAGNTYYTFRLSDGKTSVKVFSFGQSLCRPGEVATVRGRFERVKHLGSYTFYDEVEAETVICR